MSTNPLNHPGQLFDLGLMNPNPKSSKTKDGPIYRVEFEVEKEVWDCFMEAETKGMLIAAKACVVVLDEGEELEKVKSPKGPFSAQAQVLWRSSFFRTPAVWECLGSDEDYLAWLRKRPCCIDAKAFGQHEGDIVPMHVRRVAAGAGTGTKPPFSAIPGCWRHHELQHSSGESAVGGKDFYDRQRIIHVQRWVWETLTQLMGAASMTEIAPVRVREWAAGHGLDGYLPGGYR